MKRSDYKCHECGYIWEHIVNFKDSFPSILTCPQCNATANRIYSGFVFDVAEGKEITYHCSKFGRMKGQKVK